MFLLSCTHDTITITIWSLCHACHVAVRVAMLMFLASHFAMHVAIRVAMPMFLSVHVAMSVAMHVVMPMLLAMNVALSVDMPMCFYVRGRDCCHAHASGCHAR